MQLSSLAVLVRQTNAVWLLFLVGSLMLAELSRIGVFVYVADSAGGLWFRDRDVTLRELRALLRALASHWAQLLRLSWPLLLPVLGLALFVLTANGGSLVLGDKEQHTPRMHGAMLAYLCGLHALFMLPVYAARLRGKLAHTGTHATPACRAHALLL